MRFRLAMGVLWCASCVFAQVEDPEVARAKAGIDRLRALVEAGAAPRADLDRAEAGIRDAEDAAYLRKTLYGAGLTEDQTATMIAAAQRRLERRQQELARAEELVNQGVSSRASLGAFLDEVDRAQKELDLARSRAKLTEELAEMARREEALETDLERAPAEAQRIAERFDGDGVFTQQDFRRIESAFAVQFLKPLPVSAIGETAVHRALGFDHRDRVDVALHPDQPEGIWLRHFLTEHHIPFFAFRQAVPGKATAAHIHIGPMSTRLARGG